MLTDAAVIEFFDNEMALVKLNDKKDSVLTKEFKVSGFPTLVMIGADGKEIDRLVGYYPPAKFITELRNYQNGIGTLDDLLNKVAENPDRTMYEAIAEKYQYRGGAEECKKWYQRIVDEGDPRDSLSGGARSALATMLMREKKSDEAIAAFTSIMADFPEVNDGLVAEIQIARIYQQKKDSAEAITRFEAYVANHPDSKYVKFCNKQLESLKGPKKEEEAAGGK